MGNDIDASNLKTKAVRSNAVAVISVENGKFYDSGASEKYYSILQLMLSKLVLKGINLKSLQRGDSHSFTLSEFLRYYSSIDIDSFEDDMRDLKKYRQQADYTPEFISIGQFKDIEKKYSDLKRIIDNLTT